MKSLSSRDKTTGHFAAVLAVFAGLILLAACESPRPTKGAGESCFDYASRHAPEEFNRAVTAAEKLYPDEGVAGGAIRRKFARSLLEHLCYDKECAPGAVKGVRFGIIRRNTVLLCSDSSEWETRHICSRSPKRPIYVAHAKNVIDPYGSKWVWACKN